MQVSGAPGTLSHLDRIKQLEQDLKISNEVSLRLQKELEDSHKKLEESTKNTPTKKKAPLLGALGKSPSGDGVSSTKDFELDILNPDFQRKKYQESH